MRSRAMLLCCRLQQC
uniref:Uncharacterized protein n=1 Tax=Anguilla anguilla TaxID=7936 RepID=A0A0E9VR84_ANGAN